MKNFIAVTIFKAYTKTQVTPSKRKFSVVDITEIFVKVLPRYSVSFV